MDRPNLVVMGRASGAFGLRGEVRVFPFGQDPATLTEAPAVFVGPNPESARRLTPEGWRAHGQRLLLKAREVTTREQADALGGNWVYLPREEFAPLDEGEYYWADLKRAAVHTAEGRLLGRVKAVTTAGAHDLLVVEGDGGAELLLPMIEDVVVSLDPAGGRIVVDPLEGLLEAQGWPEEP